MLSEPERILSKPHAHRSDRLGEPELRRVVIGIVEPAFRDNRPVEMILGELLERPCCRALLARQAAVEIDPVFLLDVSADELMQRLKVRNSQPLQASFYIPEAMMKPWIAFFQKPTPDELKRRADQAGLKCFQLGRVGGSRLVFSYEGDRVIDIAMDDLETAWRQGLPQLL